MKDRQTISSIEDWETVAKTIIASAQAEKVAPVVALVGDLGVGKTTLVQAIARQLGVVEPVTSPTFTILKQYDTTHPQLTTLAHMDAYRLESTAELSPLNFTELLETPHTLVCVEWADKITEALPANTVWLQLSIDQQGNHTIQKQ
jgi:tRNA threonylcarbamoyladenosine biosynthesis protein TsaE